MISTKQFALGILAASLLGGAVTLGGFKVFFDNKPQTVISQDKNTARLATLLDKNFIIPDGLNFVAAAEIVSPAVVHIKTSYENTTASRGSNDPFEEMFKQMPHGKMQPRSSSGSGVITSEDGYVITNNHVIEGSENIEVILQDKRSYKAKVIGKDPSTDLALLKIEEKGLPALKYGNSDEVRIGEWVLAVGNPLDLTSTVTAGIISAKARNIRIIKNTDNAGAVEAFLQTDAAVNPGNSGGALVNLRGELVGINTAIASETGSYQGYSFAIPANLVKKVIADLKEHGEVQRALLGISIRDINSQVATEKKLPSLDGVLVESLAENSSAAGAGMQDDDVILSIDDKKTNTVSRLQEVVASKRPGEKVEVLFRRGTTEKKVTISLKNRDGNTDIVKRRDNKTTNILGADLTTINEETSEKFGINGGVMVMKVRSGKMRNAGIREGFVITHFSKNGRRDEVSSVEDIRNALMKAEENNESIYLDGVYANGEKAYYPIGW